MIHHTELGRRGFARSRRLFVLVKNGEIAVGGNSTLMIYGLLTCASGKRLKDSNRVFFRSLGEAIALGYRPCGNCLRKAYQEWKTSVGK